MTYGQAQDLVDAAKSFVTFFGVFVGMFFIHVLVGTVRRK